MNTLLNYNTSRRIWSQMGPSLPAFRNIPQPSPPIEAPLAPAPWGGGAAGGKLDRSLIVRAGLYERSLRSLRAPEAAHLYEEWELYANPCSRLPGPSGIVCCTAGSATPARSWSA